MTIFGSGHQVVTSTTRPTVPIIGQIIYQTDTDEYLKYVSYGGANRWMQVDVKPNNNVVINGGFDVWQRGNSISAGGGGATTYSADRWAFGNNGASAYSVSRTTNVPYDRFAYSARVTCTNGSIGLNGFIQLIEDLNVYQLRGRSLTMSFWVRGSKSYSGVSYGVSTGTTINQNPGVGNGFTGNASVLSSTVNITTSWQYVSFSSTTLVPSNAAVMNVSLPRPTTFATSDWVEFAGVQVEVGTAPSEFSFEPNDTTLLKCQRYYAASLSSSDYFANAYFWGAGPNGLYNFGIGVAFPRAMRIVPALAVNFINFDNTLNGGQTVHASGFTQYYRNANGGFPYCGWRATYTASAEL